MATATTSEMALGVAARCWTDPATENLVLDTDLAVAFAERVQGYLDLIETAWGVIANAEGWDEDSEWHRAAIRWRDRWHELLRNDGDPSRR